MQGLHSSDTAFGFHSTFATASMLKPILSRRRVDADPEFEKPRTVLHAKKFVSRMTLTHRQVNSLHQRSLLRVIFVFRFLILTTA